MADMDEPNIANLINELSGQFDALCQQRHETGQAEYGTFTFLGNDVVEMLMEELADAANYARYHFIKLAILQMWLEAETENQGQEPKLGRDAFVRVAEMWEKKK